MDIQKSLSLIDRYKMKVKYIRKKRKLNQSDVARAIGVSERTYQRLESGEHLPDFEQQIKLAEVLEVEFDFLFTTKPAPKPACFCEHTKESFYALPEIKESPFLDYIELPELEKFMSEKSIEKILEYIPFMSCPMPLFFSDYQNSFLNYSMNKITQRNSFKIKADKDWPEGVYLTLWDYVISNDVTYHSNILTKKFHSETKRFKSFVYSKKDPWGHSYCTGTISL